MTHNFSASFDDFKKWLLDTQTCHYLEKWSGCVVVLPFVFIFVFFFLSNFKNCCLYIVLFCCLCAFAWYAYVYWFTNHLCLPCGYMHLSMFSICHTGMSLIYQLCMLCVCICASVFFLYIFLHVISMIFSIKKMQKMHLHLNVGLRMLINVHCPFTLINKQKNMATLFKQFILANHFLQTVCLCFSACLYITIIYVNIIITMSVASGDNTVTTIYYLALFMYDYTLLLLYCYYYSFTSYVTS